MVKVKVAFGLQRIFLFGWLELGEDDSRKRRKRAEERTKINNSKVERANRPARYLTRKSRGVVGGFWGS